MGFKEIASSPLLYCMVIGMIIYIAVFAGVFLKRGCKRAKELGIERTMVKNIIKSSVTFTMIPSVAVMIGFFSLSAALGVPWPWLRLSVIGAVGYELMSADMASKAMGYADLAGMAAANDALAFAAIMFVMTIGIMSSIVVVLLFGKKIQLGIMKVRKNDSEWGVVMGNCFMLTMMTVFLPLFLVSGPILILTLATSAIVTVLERLIIKKFKLLWLNNFVQSFALVIAMASSVLWTNLFS